MQKLVNWILVVLPALAIMASCGTRGESDADSLLSALFESESQSANGPHAAGVSGFAQLRNISLSDADVRLQRHSIAAKLGENLEGRVSRLYGGLWITKDDRIQIGIARYLDNGQTQVVKSEFDAVRAQILEIALSFDVQKFVDIVEVRYSWNELKVRNDQFARLIFKGGLGVTTAIHTPTNSIIMRAPDYRTLSRQELNLIEVAKASSGSVTTGTYSTPFVKRDCPAGSCHPPYPNLDPPLRGGIKLYYYAGVTWHERCTAGFIAKSKVDHIRYVITAGHCIYETGQIWGAKKQNGDILMIGLAHNYVHADSDMAIIQLTYDTLPPEFQNPTNDWNPQKWVYVTASDDTTYDPSYYISSISTSVIGQRVCTSGSSYKESSCGFVTELGYSSNIGTNMGRASFCGVSGDSGAPIYASHVAYGIQIGGGSECDSIYQGITEVENRMNVNVDY